MSRRYDWELYEYDDREICLDQTKLQNVTLAEVRTAACALIVNGRAQEVRWHRYLPSGTLSPDHDLVRRRDLLDD